jgi:NAD(P)-dependent dehydrogenase (short-subunit alcohol dehydrogenase family)
MDRLKGKTAIVTGGANGIGRAICELFSEEGAWVLIVDLDEKRGQELVLAIRTRGGEADFCHADVGKEEDVMRAVSMAAARSGHIDILCNNAAYLSPNFHAALESTDEEWRKCIDVALLGTHYFTKAALPYMITQQKGSIVNVVSIQAMEGMMSSAAYTATKAGLLGYAMSISYDYGGQNIRINSLCPGPIQTRISVDSDNAHLQWQCDQTTLGRVGLPREVAWAALFLASDESSFVTGITLPVDGGWTSSSARKRP